MDMDRAYGTQVYRRQKMHFLPRNEFRGYYMMRARRHLDLQQLNESPKMQQMDFIIQNGKYLKSALVPAMSGVRNINFNAVGMINILTAEFPIGMPAAYSADTETHPS